MKTDLFRNSPSWVLALLIVVATWAAFIATASASPVTVEWTNPTKNTDDSAMEGDSALATTRVEYGTCIGSEFGAAQGEVRVPAPDTATTINLAAGTWCVRAFAINAAGTESAASNVAVKSAALPTPCPPEIVDSPPAKKPAVKKPVNRKAAQITVEK